jgi:hypothetical protein
MAEVNTTWRDANVNSTNAKEEAPEEIEASVHQEEHKGWLDIA